MLTARYRPLTSVGNQRLPFHIHNYLFYPLLYGNIQLAYHTTAGNAVVFHAMPFLKPLNGGEQAGIVYRRSGVAGTGKIAQ